MDFNDEQKQAATFDGKHCLVLAGAGTGKTTTIIGRVAHLIHSGVQTQRILLLTFTRRSAREMKQRLGRFHADASKKISAGTFHHFCLTYMRRWPDAFGTAGTTVIDRDDQVQLMKLARATHPESDKTLPPAATLVNLYSYARNTNQPLKDYFQKFTDMDETTMAAAIAVMGVYTERKRECHYLDYDDILHVFATRIHRDGKLREKLASRFDHILVDEMQDTNPLQWLILDALRDHAQLFCVGDDAQSIYAFRGADFKNVHAFTERVADSKTLKLQCNYRSTQEILDLSNWLLQQSPLTYDKHLVSHRGKGIKPQLIDFDDDFEEANWIAEDLSQRHGEGAAYRDHMILTRTAFGARSIEAALIEHEIPYRFIGGTTLLKSAHVKDLMALVRLVDNRSDELAWMRYLTLWPRIGEKTAAKFIPKLSSFENVEQMIAMLAKQYADKPELANVIDQVHQNWRDPAKAVRAAADGLSPLLESKYDNWDGRKKDFALLIRLASKHESVAEFIETYTLDPVTESEINHEDNDDVVTLITVHSAKGTESPVAYLIGVQPGNYPHTRSVGKSDEEEEERRVLYVAMTRAMNELILTRTLRSHGGFVPHWNRQFSAAPMSAGYFLNDLPPDLTQNEIHIDRDPFDTEIISFRQK
jgi:DNA helicase II / ATP-dependent DNA helicase PcrA